MMDIYQPTQFNQQCHTDITDFSVVRKCKHLHCWFVE